MQERIDELKNSYSAKDRRIADILTDCKEKGEVIYDDYIQRGEQTKWNSDMVFASQMGLVERITSKQYRILNEPNTSNLVLSKGQEKFVKEIYKSFGNKMFSHEMILAKLDYSSSRASTYLHQFTILRIVDCDKGDTYMYRLLINPKEHPEYFYNAA